MTPRTIPKEMDTVIVGNGPSALILSFILHGNIPYYDCTKPHPDPILRGKVLQLPSLLELNVTDLTAHFGASRLSYSTQALSINTLLDTLIRPLADTDPGEYESCVKWHCEESRRISHVVLGNATQPGGQWIDNATAPGSGIGTLSYAEMLSLPGYSIETHLSKSRGSQVTKCCRPTRHEVAEYLAAYPDAVNIADSIFTHVNVRGVSRVEGGFYIGSHGVFCKYLVLASGVFSNPILPPSFLRPLISTSRAKTGADLPLLVIGSGFTAADVILSCPPGKKIIHMYKWLSDRPSPLQACHPRAYPEYASIYRQMKLAAKRVHGSQPVRSPSRQKRRKSFLELHELDRFYEGFPNAVIKDIFLDVDGAFVVLETSDGRIVHREVSNLEYVIGRRGSLDYLESGLLKQVLDGSHSPGLTTHDISSRTLRAKVEENLEVAPNVFVIGSLTGDSLIRFAHGGCVFAAHQMMKRVVGERTTDDENSTTMQSALDTSLNNSSCIKKSSRPLDLDNDNGHSTLATAEKKKSLSSQQPVDRGTKPDCWRGTSWTLEVS